MSKNEETEADNETLSKLGDLFTDALPALRAEIAHREDVVTPADALQHQINQMHHKIEQNRRPSTDEIRESVRRRVDNIARRLNK
jgi:hypothetical protein